MPPARLSTPQMRASAGDAERICPRRSASRYDGRPCGKLHIPVNGVTGTISQNMAPPAEAGSPREQPDFLAGALLSSLMRPMAEKFAPGVLWTGLLGFFSLGII